MAAVQGVSANPERFTLYYPIGAVSPALFPDHDEFDDGSTVLDECRSLRVRLRMQRAHHRLEPRRGQSWSHRKWATLYLRRLLCRSRQKSRAKDLY
jgi:hypothetical protein